MRIFLGFFVALMVTVVGTSAWAQASIEVSNSVADAAPPARILAMQPGTQSYVADLNNRWGTLEVPPGRYEVMVIPQGDRAVPVRFGPFDVSSGAPTTVDIASGVRLTSGDGLPPLEWWIVTDATDGEVVAQVASRWGYTPLPPGRYRVEVPLPGETVSSASIDVPADDVAEIDLASLGIGRVVLEMPDADDVFLFGEEGMTPILELGGEHYDIGAGRQGEEIAMWIKSQPIALERRAGAFVDRTSMTVPAGGETRVPFNLGAIVEERGLSVFELERGAGGAEPERLTVVAARGDRALLSTDAPRLGVRYIAPGGAVVRISGPDGRQRLETLAIGETARLAAPAGDAGGGGSDVSLAVEEPGDGAELDAETRTATVIGQASETAEAGLIKIALVIDTSGSTADPSGSDIDGDGSVDTILDAEKAAAQALIAALAEIEDGAPGTAFALSVVEFGDTAHSLVPLLPLTEPLAVERLTRTASALSHGVQGGSTFYDRAIDVALRVLSSGDRAGPEIILLVTDGKPSQIVPAIDASARAGLKDVMLHTIGLGTDFRGATPEDVSYPPVSEDGPVILAQMAAFGTGGGRAWALPAPADIVALVPSLPVLERRDAGIRSISIRNETLDQAADDVDLRQDGTFSASVPVAFGPPDAGWSNVLSITATGLSGATARQEVRVLAAGLDLAVWEEAEADREELARQIEELSARVEGAEEAAAERAAEVERLTAALAELEGADAERERMAGEVTEIAARADSTARDAARKAREIETLKASLAAAEEASALRSGELARCSEARRQCDTELADALQQLFSPTPVADGIVVTVPGDVLFDFDTTEVRPDAQQALGLAAAFLRDYEKSDLVVEGHTDSVGSESYNAELSRARAEAVATWLIDQAGIAADRIASRGLGESRPVAEETLPDGSDSPEGRQRNRRVEIRILK